MLQSHENSWQQCSCKVGKNHTLMNKELKHQRRLGKKKNNSEWIVAMCLLESFTLTLAFSLAEM